MDHLDFHNRTFFFLCLLTIILLTSCNMPIDSVLGVATPTQFSSPTPISLPTQATGIISGLVWHDLCAAPGDDQPIPDEPPEGCVVLTDGGFGANGTRESGEPGIEGLEVTLGSGACPSAGLASATTDAEGSFSLSGLGAGTYCLMIDPSQGQNTEILIPGEWTAGQADASGLISLTIELISGEEAGAVEFGWDYQFLPPYEPPATETPTPTATTETGTTSTPTSTPDMTPTPTTPTPTTEATTTGGDPDLPTGDPAWKDSFSSGDNWPLYEDDHVRFSVSDGKAVLTAFNADYYEGWMLSWPQLTDFYLEGTFKTGTCSGRDRYGLMTRSTSSDDGYIGYLFGVTCDGRYSLRTWDGEQFEEIIPWTVSDQIQVGSDKTNKLGFWAKGNSLILYVNRNRVGQVTDSTHENGRFGLFVGAVATANFKVQVEEVAYWNLQ
jgi:hypothetical protein